MFRTPWTRFAFRKPRNPLLRIACGLLGVALLLVFVVFGLFIGLAMLAAAAIWRLAVALRGRGGERRDAEGVIEGEYTVVEKHHPPLAPR